MINYVIKDDSIKLIKNDNYSFDNTNLIPNIELKLIQGEEMGFAAFNTNKIDLLINPPVSSLEEINSAKYLDMYPTNTLTTLSLMRIIKFQLKWILGKRYGKL